MKFKTQWEPHGDDPAEVNDGISQTLPDQAMTIVEIIDRHTRGLPLNLSNNIPIYEGEEFHPDLDKMDLADREAYIDQAKQTLEETTTRIKTRQAEAKEKAQKAMASKRLQFNHVEDSDDDAANANNPDPKENSAGGTTKRKNPPHGL